MGFEVQIEDLRDSADAARTVASSAKDSDAGAALSEAKSSMPGATCLAQIDAVAKHWKSSVNTWAKVATSYASGLERSADNYEKSDDAARRAFPQPIPSGPKAR